MNRLGCMTRTVIGLLAYLVLVVPAVGAVGVVEGSLRGDWGLSSDDWARELGGYVVAFAAPVGLAGLLVVPLVALASRANSRKGRGLAGAAAGAGGMCGGLFAYAFAWSLVGFPLSWPMGLFQSSPAAFLATPAILGALGAIAAPVMTAVGSTD
jgi:hypothetical protein